MLRSLRLPNIRSERPKNHPGSNLSAKDRPFGFRSSLLNTSDSDRPFDRRSEVTSSFVVNVSHVREEPNRVEVGEEGGRTSERCRRDEVEAGEEEGRLMRLDVDPTRKAKTWCRQSWSPGRPCGWTRWTGVSRRGGTAAWQWWRWRMREN